jgi:hypothetical protein
MAGFSFEARYDREEAFTKGNTQMSDTFQYRDAQGNPITSEEAAQLYKSAPLSPRARKEAEEEKPEGELQEGQQSGPMQLNG